MARLRIGEWLVQNGHVSPERMEYALNVRQRSKELLGEVLVRLGFVREEAISRALAAQYQVAHVEAQSLHLENVDKPRLDRLTLAFARERCVLPVIVRGQPMLVVADILDTATTDHARRQLGQIAIGVGPRSAIQLALEVLAYQSKDADQLAESTRGQISGGEINELLGYLLGRAVLASASDIHIEPAGPTSLIRFRVDGILRAELTIPRERHDNLMNVLFGKAGLDLSDFMRFHDGRFAFNFAGRRLDVRFSCSPTIEGPLAVLRILSDNRTLRALDDLGFDAASLMRLGELLHLPHGLVLVVGPTGSGKTTTLYSLLAQLNSTQRKILTIEDPIEIRMPSIQQVQANEKAGVTFASAVRAFLRQDPDIILIGEIRDRETAEEAIRAANTGHLVFSTLHANSALESVSRLLDLGVASHLVATALIGVVSQRFVRRLCPKCRVRVRVEGQSALVLHPGAVFEPGDGCANCREGFSGRALAAEVWALDEEVRRSVHRAAPVAELQTAAMAGGFRPIRESAMQLVRAGTTSITEVERVFGPALGAVTISDLREDETFPGGAR